MRQPKIYKEEVPLEEQLGKRLNEILNTVIKKTTEDLGHKSNKQQSIANPTLGKQFLKEVISLSPPMELYPPYFQHYVRHFLGINTQI